MRVTRCSVHAFLLPWPEKGAADRGVYESYDNSTNITFSFRGGESRQRGFAIIYESLTRSLPLARPSRACGFATFLSPLPKRLKSIITLISLRNLWTGLLVAEFKHIGR